MPKTVRSTKNPIGRKFLEVMDSMKPPQDIVAVAKAFDVKVPSVYDWINHGRIAKTRYAQLVVWSGRSLDWWFDIPAQAASAPHVAEVAAHPYVALPEGLNSAQRDVLEAFGNLAPERRKAVRDELMAEAALYMSAWREYQAREGLTGTVTEQRAAETLPKRPDGDQPETVPGLLT